MIVVVKITQVDTWYNGNNQLSTWWDSGSNRYTLRDYCRGSFILTKYSDGSGQSDFDSNSSYFIEANGSEATPLNSNWNWDFKAKSAGSAHFGMQVAHYYFKSRFNRNGAFGDGRELRVVVNNYIDNAFYSSYNGNDYVTVGRLYNYGGGGRSFAELDVMAHEYTHGVVAGSAGLINSGEPAALNESFADIFGEMAELMHTGRHDWTVLRGVGIPRAFAEVAPSFAGFGQPAQVYQGRNWDFGGEPHQNGGVQNRWFFLLSVGGTGEDGIRVTGIGEDKAASITYRSLTRYLGPNSTYADARAGSIQAAIDLYGLCSAEVTATTNAWAAVHVGNPASPSCAGDIFGTSRFCTEQGTSVNAAYRVSATPGAIKTWSADNSSFYFSQIGQVEYAILSRVPSYQSSTTLSVRIDYPGNAAATV